jgi:hypothetical protein
MSAPPRTQHQDAHRLAGSYNPAPVSLQLPCEERTRWSCGRAWTVRRAGSFYAIGNPSRAGLVAGGSSGGSLSPGPSRGGAHPEGRARRGWLVPRAELIPGAGLVAGGSSLGRGSSRGLSPEGRRVCVRPNSHPEIVGPGWRPFSGRLKITTPLAAMTGAPIVHREGHSQRRFPYAALAARSKDHPKTIWPNSKRAHLTWAVPLSAAVPPPRSRRR